MDIPNIFNEQIVKEMASHVERPIIFPLSNPTSRAEGIPKDILNWTNNKAIIGTGSPFPEIDQVNNSYIFPGMGLGIISVKSTRVTEEMFLEAAKTLAECSPAKQNSNEKLLPSLKEIRKISYKIAFAVAKVAIKQKLAPPYSDEELEELICSKMWFPKYVPYKKSLS